MPSTYTKLLRDPTVPPRTRASLRKIESIGSIDTESSPLVAIQDVNPSQVVNTAVLTHVGGLLCLVAVVALLLVTRFARIDASYGSYVRGAVTVLTGMTASVSTHKASSTVAVSSLKRSTPPSDVKVQAAMGHPSLLRSPTIEDSLHYSIAYVETFCSGAAVFLAGACIDDTVRTPENLRLKPVFAYPLLGVCALWFLALVAHAIAVGRNRQTLAFLEASSKLAREASTASLMSM